MKIFRKFLSRRGLDKFFIFIQKGNIWRIFFCGDEIIAGESRDLEKKQAYFFTLNYKTKQLFLKNFQVEEKWWVGIENVNDNLMFINSFKKPDLPEHLGIIAVDIISGGIKWSNNNLTFLFATNEEVYAYKQLFETKIFYKLNTKVGEIEKEIKEQEEINSIFSLKTQYEKNQYEGFIYPDIYNSNYSRVNILIREYFTSRFAEVEIHGNIEFIEYNEYLIYNFHFRKGLDLKDINRKILQNNLEIYSLNSNEVIFDEILNSEVVSYVPDSFFIKDEFLFYVKEKKELTLVKLKF